MCRVLSTQSCSLILRVFLITCCSAINAATHHGTAYSSVTSPQRLQLKPEQSQGQAPSSRRPPPQLSSHRQMKSVQVSSRSGRRQRRASSCALRLSIMQIALAYMGRAHTLLQPTSLESRVAHQSQAAVKATSHRQPCSAYTQSRAAAERLRPEAFSLASSGSSSSADRPVTQRQRRCRCCCFQNSFKICCEHFLYNCPQSHAGIVFFGFSVLSVERNKPSDNN